MEKRRSKRRFNLSSFPQYVNRVQSKMNELKIQSLANAQKYDSYQTVSKRGRSPRTLAAASELSPKRSRPLPRTLSPLRQKPSGSREDSRRMRNATDRNDDKTRGSSREGQRVSARETFWSSRRQFPAGLAQQLHNAVRGPHLTLPFQRMPGVSVNSLSSGSSSASSNASTPFPPSPSPVTFLTPSKTSISSSEQSPPTQKRCLDNPQSKRNSKSPSISLNQLNVSSSSLQKSASVPQLRNRSAPKSPLASYSPSPGPACSPYLMPITRLKPTTRPKRETKSSTSQNGKKRQRKSSYSESSKTLAELEQPAKKAANLQQTVPLWNPSYPNTMSATPVLPPISTADSADTLRPNIAFSVVDAVPQDSLHTSGPGLTIPTIMIRSATPIRSPSADDSLASLCEKFVYRAELAEELDQLKSELKDISETNDALSNDT